MITAPTATPGKLMPHVVIDHRYGYVDPDDRGIHTNTIEDFGHSSNAPGMAPITTTHGATCPCSLARPLGSTTIGTMPAASMLSWQLASSSISGNPRREFMADRIEQFEVAFHGSAVDDQYLSARDLGGSMIALGELLEYVNEQLSGGRCSGTLRIKTPRPRIIRGCLPKHC